MLGLLERVLDGTPPTGPTCWGSSSHMLRTVFLSTSIWGRSPYMLGKVFLSTSMIAPRSSFTALGGLANLHAMSGISREWYATWGFRTVRA